MEEKGQTYLVSSVLVVDKGPDEDLGGWKGGSPSAQEERRAGGQMTGRGDASETGTRGGDLPGGPAC